jgi:hypothetical protein
MGIITTMVQQCMERFQQTQMKLQELNQPRWEDAAHYLCETHEKYGTSELMFPAVIQLETDNAAATPEPTPFGERMERPDIVPRLSQMRQETT